jgi:uncharacterized membrane protein
MATLIAISYPDQDRAKLAMASVDWLDYDKLLDVKASCWVTKENGELVVHQAGYPSAAKKTLGGSLGLIVGGIIGLPVVGLATGIALGARKGKKDDHRIDEEFISSVGSALDAGGSAIFILWDEGAGTLRSAHELAQYGGTVHSTDLSTEQLDRFQALLDERSPDTEVTEETAPEP